MLSVMKLLGLTAVAFAGLVLAAACSDGDGKDDGTADGGAGNQVVVGTYNAGLALSFVKYTLERSPAIVDAMKNQQFDVLCLQEVWRQGDWDALARALPGLPNQTRREAEPSATGPSCIAVELDPLQACAETSCGTVPASELTQCVLDFCQTEVDGVTGNCLNCLVENIGTGDFAQIRSACEIVGGMADAGTGSPGFAFGGSFGTGILSKFPFAEVDSRVLESTSTRRNVNYARISASPVGELDVFCTHLTADLTQVPYSGTFGSWAEEQSLQIDAMLAFVEQKSGDSGTIVMMGDFNTGPAVGNATADLPDNYAKLIAGGFDNPYAAQSDAACSFCASNQLIGGADPVMDSGVLIDHVLLRRFSGSAAGEQFLREAVELDTDADGLVTTSYSDHYGLRVTLTAASP